MSFLSSEQIVIDTHEQLAINKQTGFDLLNPPPGIPQPQGKQWTMPPPTPKKIRPPKPPTLENSGAPALAGCMLPGPIMATVWDHIKGLAFQELLKEKDAKMKLKFADRFSLLSFYLLDSTKDIPGHMFHHICLKDPAKVNNNKAYAAPKKYQESWKGLLDDHLEAGHIQPSSSEFASPAFCIPKYIARVPDLTVDPQWVNDYQALNSNTLWDNFLLPCIDNILAHYGKGKIFGKMDMTNSFFQTQVHPDDIHLTAPHCHKDTMFGSLH